MMRSIDNDVYDRLGGSWWDETSLLNLLHGSMTPGRLAYFRGVLARQFGAGIAGLRVLDIGSGGGFLAEEFAAMGCRVTGVDPSPVSIEAARAHAAERGLRIDYRVGAGEELPVPDTAFDVACCCDVLEHVSDVDRVITETARVLEPGGLYLFDTINRTRTSRLLAIKAVQQWRLTRLTDVAFHDWDMFITPAELAAILERHGLAPGETTGLGARAKPLTVLRSLASARLGRITYGELSRRLDVGQVSSTALSYMGFAAKAQRVTAGRELPGRPHGRRQP
jgi:2-polyprenyl-6-hydroxyphenyl methylase/3-demethylubiquinone-9 3-methyltransferase